MLLVVTDSTLIVPTDELYQLNLPWKQLSLEDTTGLNQNPWSATIVAVEKIENAFSISQSLLNSSVKTGPVLVLTPADNSGKISGLECNDFAFLPLHKGELSARISRLLQEDTAQVVSNVVSYGPVELNLSTYQASVAGKLLDMTYMEYELLRYFVTNPNQVLSREQLLRDVWRYEYYGGARTVDVHVRRLRAKLGEEQAQLIQTVRSVGYMFGKKTQQEPLQIQ